MPFFGLWRRKRRRGLLRLPQASTSRLYRRTATAVAYMVLIVAGHALAMAYFEGMGLGDGLWLTMTSITTVGYGDLSAATWQGRWATVLIIYFGGIFVVGKFAGDFFDYRASRRDALKQGKWDFSDMEDHIIIIGTEQDFEYYFTRLIGELKHDPRTADRKIVLISTSFDNGLPMALENLGVRFVNGAGGDPEALDRAGVDGAGIVIVLAWNENEVRTDGKTFDIIHRIRDSNTKATIVAECVDDDNRERLKTAGASIVVRPVRSYPEMIVGAFLNPGSSDILENLFTAEGERIVCLEHEEHKTWAEIVSDYVTRGQGIPIAYRDRSTEAIVTAPEAGREVNAMAIFVLS